MRLDALDLEDTGIKAYLAGLNQSGLGQATFGHFSNWCDTIDDFSSYWESRPARLRATVQRKLRAIRKAHGISFQLAKDPGELCQALKDYLRIYAASWKEPEPHPDFIPILVHELGLESSLRLGTLSIDGVVAAAQIWLEKGSRLTIFKLAHGKEFASHSPGTILTHWLLQSLCTPGCTWKVDFGRGDDAYKRDWLENCRPRHGLVVANWRSSRGLATLLCEICPTRVANIWKKGSHSYLTK